MKNLVTSLELSKRLYEAGVVDRQQNEYVFWWQYGNDYRTVGENRSIRDFPALTLQELLEVMPARQKQKKEAGDIWSYELTQYKTEQSLYSYAYICDGRLNDRIFEADSPLKALESLCNYLLDNNLM